MWRQGRRSHAGPDPLGGTVASQGCWPAKLLQTVTSVILHIAPVTLLRAYLPLVFETACKSSRLIRFRCCKITYLRLWAAFSFMVWAVTAPLSPFIFPLPQEEKGNMGVFFDRTSLLRENILESGIGFPSLTSALSWNARNAPEIEPVCISRSHFLMSNLHSVLVELM